MIEVCQVSKSFGRVRAVAGVSFGVGRGEVVGLLGANGAGKTTTLRMAAGFLAPDGGAIAIAGHDTVRASAAARRSVGYLAEAAPAYAEMSVEGYLDFRGRLHGIRRGARRGAIDRALGACELEAVRRRRVGQLSRGLRQRVGLAAAILSDPAAVILDEPGSALDPRQIRSSRRLIRQLASEGKAVLVSTHILPEAEQVCDRLVIMAAGEVRAEGRPGELLGARADAPYIVEAGASTDRVGLVLAAVRGVERFEALQSGDREWSRVRVIARGGGDLRAAIALALGAEGIVVRELAREAASLEGVFLRLVEQEQRVGAAA